MVENNVLYHSQNFNEELHKEIQAKRKENKGKFFEFPGEEFKVLDIMKYVNIFNKNMVKRIQEYKESATGVCYSESFIKNNIIFSNYGRLYNLVYNREYPFRPFSTTPYLKGNLPGTSYITSSGYPQLVVCYLHVVLSYLFKDKRNKDQNIVDHIDGIKYNNTLDNLRWVTHKENCNNRINKKNKSYDTVYVYDIKKNKTKLCKQTVGNSRKHTTSAIKNAIKYINTISESSCLKVHDSNPHISFGLTLTTDPILSNRFVVYSERYKDLMEYFIRKGEIMSFIQSLKREYRPKSYLSYTPYVNLKLDPNIKSFKIPTNLL